jgi:hypothetical protein
MLDTFTGWAKRANGKIQTKWLGGKNVVAVRSNLVAWRNEPSSLMSRREKPLTRGRDEFPRDPTPRRRLRFGHSGAGETTASGPPAAGTHPLRAQDAPTQPDVPVSKGRSPAWLLLPSAESGGPTYIAVDSYPSLRFKCRRNRLPARPLALRGGARTNPRGLHLPLWVQGFAICGCIYGEKLALSAVF